MKSPECNQLDIRTHCPLEKNQGTGSEYVFCLEHVWQRSKSRGCNNFLDSFLILFVPGCCLKFRNSHHSSLWLYDKRHYIHIHLLTYYSQSNQRSKTKNSSHLIFYIRTVSKLFISVEIYLVSILRKKTPPTTEESKDQYKIYKSMCTGKHKRNAYASSNYQLQIHEQHI